MSRQPNKRSKRPEADFKSGFIALVGPANSGKSTLLNSLVGEKISIVSPKEQTTRRRILGIKTTDHAQFVFVDTPGFMARHYRGELARYINRVLHQATADVDLTVLVIDAPKMAAEEGDLERVCAALRRKKISRVSIIALNKIDRLEKRRLLPLLADLQQTFAGWSTRKGQPLEFVPISALTGDGLDLLEKVMQQHLAPGPAYFPKDMITDQPNQHLAAEIIREKLMLHLTEELPYSVAVCVDQWEEKKRILHIGGTILVDRPSQKSIVIGRGGTKLKAVGRAARTELERIFGVHIFLELLVRVEQKWTASRKGLRKAGYDEVES